MGTLGDIRCFYVYNDALFIGTNYGIVKYENSEFTVHFLDNEKKPLYLYVSNDILYSCSDGSGLIAFNLDLDKLYTIKDTENKVILKTVTLDYGMLYSSGTELYYVQDNVTTRINLPNYGSVSDIIISGNFVIVCTTSEIFYIRKDDLLLGNVDNYKRIGLANGLESGITANGSSYIDPVTNTYYFSCQDGVYKFDYKNFGGQSESIKIAISAVREDGKDISSTSVALSKNCSRLVVDLSVLRYIDYEEYTVYYMLEGYDKKFQTFDYNKSQSIVYTNLSGGNYTLKLYVKSLSGDVSEMIVLPIAKELKIQENAWFYPVSYSAVILVILLICYFIGMSIVMSVKKRNKELKEFTSGALEAFARTIDAKDKYTIGHSIRVAKYSVLIARELNLGKNEIDDIYYIALLHDIGKIGVPDNVLNYPGRLSNEQYGYIKKHPEIGEDILHSIHTINHLCDGVLYHHEKFDGTGYPEGLSGSNIPLYGRIICCADCYDAMASKRVYRDKLDHDYIVSEFERCSGTQFDPEIAQITIKLIKSHQFDKIEEEGLY